MNRLLELYKYLKYIDLFLAIGAAMKAGSTGDDFTVTQDISVKGRAKNLFVSMRDRTL